MRFGAQGRSHRFPLPAALFKIVSQTCSCSTRCLEEAMEMYKGYSGVMCAVAVP
jgi:hypothetical protein